MEATRQMEVERPANLLPEANNSLRQSRFYFIFHIFMLPSLQGNQWGIYNSLVTLGLSTADHSLNGKSKCTY